MIAAVDVEEHAAFAATCGIAGAVGIAVTAMMFVLGGDSPAALLDPLVASVAGAGFVGGMVAGGGIVIVSQIYHDDRRPSDAAVDEEVGA